MFESLHNHTKTSDGEYSYLSLLAEAEENGYSSIAFTDHDVLPDEKSLNQLKNYTGPISWTVGVELTSALPKELSDSSFCNVHILGLFIDINNKELQEHIKEVHDSKIRRVKHVVKQLNKLGINITESDCFKAAEGSESIGTPHLVNAIFMHKENNKVILEIAKQLEEAGKNNSKLAERYKSMLAEGGIERYPYTLFIKSDSFIPMPKVPGGSAILDLDKTVELIRNAGGYAVLAHWYVYKEVFPKEVIIKLLKEKRIDGVETDTLDIMNRDKNGLEEDAQFLIKYVEKYKSIRTNGADAHKVGDLKLWAQRQPLAAQRSVGETDRLVKDLNPNLLYSNIKKAS